jgi:hypothetical protein
LHPLPSTTMASNFSAIAVYGAKLRIFGTGIFSITGYSVSLAAGHTASPFPTSICGRVRRSRSIVER